MPAMIFQFRFVRKANLAESHVRILTNSADFFAPKQIIGTVSILWADNKVDALS